MIPTTNWSISKSISITPLENPLCMVWSGQVPISRKVAFWVRKWPCKRFWSAKFTFGPSMLRSRRKDLSHCISVTNVQNVWEDLHFYNDRQITIRNNGIILIFAFSSISIIFLLDLWYRCFIQLERKRHIRNIVQ